jgi:hypothetical protein
MNRFIKMTVASLILWAIITLGLGYSLYTAYKSVDHLSQRCEKYEDKIYDLSQALINSQREISQK